MQTKKTILITGGAGYIGSHLAYRFLECGDEVVVIDNFSKTDHRNVDAIQKVFPKTFFVYSYDLRNKEKVSQVFERHSEISVVYHLAGYKSVKESALNPILYYQNNIQSTCTLLEVMKENEINHFVFSSSATVYGNPKYLPLDEHHPLDPQNVYGKTKLFIEEMLKDVSKMWENFRVVFLRYFNPIGLHPNGLIQENPLGTPENLFPYIQRVLKGSLKQLTVFGQDYSTEDGTCVRDYIHILDLVEGHKCSMKCFEDDFNGEPLSKEYSNIFVYNLGSGKGHSVLEIIGAIEKITGERFPYVFGPPREGDIAIFYANPKKAEKELLWKAERSLEEMCRSIV